MPGQATRLIAVRHGETSWNLAGRIQGHMDIPLNDHGRWQARQVGRALAGEVPAAIYSSDLARAAETAQQIADATGVPVQTCAGLRERAFGVFEGLTFEQIEARWPSEVRRWRSRDPAFGPEGGETLQGFFDRAVAASIGVAAQHPGQTVVIVAHGGVMDSLYRAASRQDLRATRTWELGNASINRLLHTQAGLTLVGWNDSQHLEGQALDEIGPAATCPTEP